MTKLLQCSVFAMFDMSPRAMLICILTYSCVGKPVSYMNINIMHFNNTLYFSNDDINHDAEKILQYIVSIFYFLVFLKNWVSNIWYTGSYIYLILPGWWGNRFHAVFDQDLILRRRSITMDRIRKNEGMTVQ